MHVSILRLVTFSFCLDSCYERTVFFSGYMRKYLTSMFILFPVASQGDSGRGVKQSDVSTELSYTETVER